MRCSRSDRLAHRLINTFPYVFWQLTPMRLRHWMLHKAVRRVYADA